MTLSLWTSEFRFPFLPWVFWGIEILTETLKPIGQVNSLGEHPLLRSCVQSARVCVNIIVTKPIPGSVFKHEFCLVYEGLVRTLEYHPSQAQSTYLGSASTAASAAFC